MKKAFARAEFDRLKTKYLPNNKEITFRFNRSKSRAGICYEGPLEIQLSEYFVNSPAVDNAKITDTLLHEFAHAIVGVDNMHNDMWKGVARQIGCKSDRCAGPFLMKRDYNYKMTCSGGCDIRKLKLSNKYLARPHVCKPHKKLLKITRMKDK